MYLYKYKFRQIYDDNLVKESTNIAYRKFPEILFLKIYLTNKLANLQNDICTNLFIE